MSRCIHIAINENPGAAPRRTARSLSGWAGNDDPRGSDVMPLPEDPGGSDVMPLPEDPGGSDVMPLPEDPRYAYPASYAANASNTASSGGACGATVSAHACCCAAPACPGTSAAKGAAAPNPFVRPGDYSGFVIVRLAPGIEHPTVISLWKLAKELKLKGLKDALTLPPDPDRPDRPQRHLTSRPLIEITNPVLNRFEQLARIHHLEATAATSPVPPLHSLASYWRIDLRKHPDLVEEVIAKLQRLAEVELAYRELSAADPQNGGQVFAEDQGYLQDAPDGIGASWAWQRLAALNPQIDLTLCDLEQGWIESHDDLAGKNPTVVAGDNRVLDGSSDGFHGTAVLGQLAATGAIQIQGAAATLSPFLLASHYRGFDANHPHPFARTSGHVAQAIVQTLVQPGYVFEAGDILLLEVQRGLLPTEVDEADFDAVRLASGLGVIVVEAAGNGGFNLDAWSDPDTHRCLRRGDASFRDSGAVFVGAARASLPHDRAPFSNYGSRLDCFGWGESVTTCGFGDLAGTVATNYYTNSFSGTSSAAPIAAGAAALLQMLHQAQAGGNLAPRAMRALLADPATGTRQGPNVAGFIGVMPDLRAIIRQRLQLVPDVYMRRSLGDDGAVPAAGEEVSSSPDIFAWPHGISNARARWGEGRRRGNAPAPGDPLVPGQPNNLYVRLRNRGLGEGEVHVQLFASPAATLITTERWIPIHRRHAPHVQQIPQGDTLFVAGPVVWQPPTVPSISLAGQTLAPPWSFLAVLTRPGEGAAPLGPPYYDWATGLPPGPPYFDWDQYLLFLRRHGVAWRNTHRVGVSNPAMAFCIAGTPERAHVFDFEIIQRLPQGAQVTLHVPHALEAKLRQRELLLGGVGPLVLPKRPRMTIKGIQLAAGSCADAIFEVQAANPPLDAGHSLALRQLWRGEEVGRITWYFDPNL
jgi:serine protease